MKKRKIYISITIIITLLLYGIMAFLPKTSLRGFFYSAYYILFLLLLESIAIYDITKVFKNPDKQINYINIIIFNVCIIITMKGIMDYIGFFIPIIMICVLISRGIATIISICITKIPSIKVNFKKIIIVTISSCILFISIKSIIIIKVPHQIYYETCLWTGKLRVIQNMNEFNELFNEDIISEDLQAIQILKAQQKLEESNDAWQELKEKSKKEIVAEFNIDDKFFDKYYLVFTSDASGNTAEPMGFAYITYNKMNKRVALIQEAPILPGIGGDVYSSCSYFIKIEKKYFGEVEWKTKYKLFRINNN